MWIFKRIKELEEQVKRLTDLNEEQQNRINKKEAKEFVKTYSNLINEKVTCMINFNIFENVTLLGFKFNKNGTLRIVLRYDKNNEIFDEFFNKDFDHITKCKSYSPYINKSCTEK